MSLKHTRIELTEQLGAALVWPNEGHDFITLGMVGASEGDDDGEFEVDMAYAEAEQLAIALIQATPAWPEHEQSVSVFGWDVGRDEHGLFLAGGSQEVGEASIIDYFDDPHDMVRLGIALIRAAKEAK